MVCAFVRCKKKLKKFWVPVDVKKNLWNWHAEKHFTNHTSKYGLLSIQVEVCMWSVPSSLLAYTTILLHCPFSLSGTVNSETKWLGIFLCQKSFLLYVIGRYGQQIFFSPDNKWSVLSASVWGCVLLHSTLCRLRAPVGSLTVKEQQLEGALRYVNSRVITNR